MTTTETAWRNRIVRTGQADPKELRANPKNWRTHPPEQRAALTRMLDDVGFVQQVVVNRTTGNLVDGHLRVELAVERGERRIPVVYVELTEAEEARVLAALDPLSAMAGVSSERLEALLQEIGIGDDALSRLLADTARAANINLWPQEPRWKSDPDDAPARRKTTVQAGQLFALGDHRLLCGDSTDAAVLARVTGGERAQMIFTDPPYGVAVASRVGTRARSSAEAKARGRRGIENDEMDVDTLTAFLRRFVAAVLPNTDAGAAWYVCAPHGPVGLAFSQALYEANVWKLSLVWVKDSLVLSRSDYHYRHEPIYYGWTPGAARLHPVPTRDQDTVWEIPRPKRSLEHPTMKPVALVERAIHNSSAAGDAILEPFCGSGSTLIAAERSARRCFAVELDPEFVQVTIDRWERFTGETAERIE